MGDALNPGNVQLAPELGRQIPADFEATMASAIENALVELLQQDGMNSFAVETNSRESRDRRRLLIAIAQGVIRHLVDNTDAFQVTGTDSNGGTDLGVALDQFRRHAAERPVTDIRMNGTYLNYPFFIDGRGRSAATDRDHHIRQMIEQVLFTNPGERVNRPDFGCGLRRMVFMPNGQPLAAATRSAGEERASAVAAGRDPGGEGRSERGREHAHRLRLLRQPRQRRGVRSISSPVPRRRAAVGVLQTAICKDEQIRRALIIGRSDINGIDYLNVDPTDHTKLTVFFLNPVGPKNAGDPNDSNDEYGLSGDLSKITITGGTRVVGILPVAAARNPDGSLTITVERTRRLLRLHARTQRPGPRSSVRCDRLFLHGDMSGRFRLPRPGGVSAAANSAAAARLRSEGLREFPAAALGPAAAPQSDLDRDEPVGPRHRPHRAPRLCGRSPVVFPGCGCQRSLPRHASPSHLCASTGQAHRLPDARWPQCLGRGPHRGLQPDHASARHQDPVAHR